jgi:hypothetical protein
VRDRLGLIVRLQTATRSLGTDATGNVVATDSVTLATDPTDTDNANVFQGAGGARFELTNLPLTTWAPNQRFQVTIQALDPGLC